MWAEPILHVDMDSFFVEVERLGNPSLVGQPVAVGGTGGRGVIASASYEARAFGVRSAQPTSTAKRLCPELIVVPSSHGKYGEVSSEVFGVFRSFTPQVEGLSLDEAFLDVSGLRNHFDAPVEVGSALRSRIREVTGLPASVGIAATKFVAKLASEAAKPDGLLHVSLEHQLEFLWALPAEAIWGVGPATLASLRRVGITTVGEIAEMPINALTSAVGPTMGQHLHDLSNGHDPRSVTPDSEAKSVSVEETYERDLVGFEVLESAIMALCQRLSGRLRRSGLAGRTITLKLRYEDFNTVTRSKTVDGAIDGPRNLFRIAGELLRLLDTDQPVRLLGLGASQLESADQPRQMDLGDAATWSRVENAVGQIRDRYGESAVNPARLAPNPTGSDQEPG